MRSYTVRICATRRRNATDTITYAIIVVSRCVRSRHDAAAVVVVVAGVAGNALAPQRAQHVGAFKFTVPSCACTHYFSRRPAVGQISAREACELACVRVFVFA